MLARFVPVVRTFCPIVAGAGKMEYRTFLRYNLLGGLLWGVGVTLLGYFLGNVSLITRSHRDRVDPGVVLISIVPIAIEFGRHRHKKAAAAAGPVAVEDELTPG